MMSNKPTLFDKTADRGDYLVECYRSGHEELMFSCVSSRQLAQNSNASADNVSGASVWRGSGGCQGDIQYPNSAGTCTADGINFDLPLRC